MKLDDNGRYRECVRLFSMFTASKTQWLWFKLSEQGQLTVEKKGYRPKCDLLQKLFYVAGVVDEAGAFNTMERFEGGNLNAFIAAVKAETVNIGLTLGISVREDFERKPILQLSEFLKLIGLKFGKAKARYAEGRKSTRTASTLTTCSRLAPTATTSVAASRMAVGRGMLKPRNGT